MARLHVWIEGVVQGVYFRDSTRRAANELGVTGWARNLPDGRVEAVFEGERASCERALEFVRMGPPSARVTHVDEMWEEEEGSFKGFTIRS